MKKPIKYLVNIAVRPLVKRYLSKTRIYRHGDISLAIPTQVFHPVFFFSTRFLLQYIKTLDVKNKTFLELGAGSGLIAFSAARRGAVVTATDMNPVSVEYLRKNGQTNDIPVRVLLSDLFNDIPKEEFDIIAINPPYYKKTPATHAEYAWYCGENGEYFSRLFAGLDNYTHADSTILMVLCDECDIAMIRNIAANHGYDMQIVKTISRFSEINYIFSIRRI